MPPSNVPIAAASLACHAQTPCAAVHSIDVAILLTGPRTLLLRYALRGEMGRLRLPSPQAPAPRDRLWAHTCCEAFIAGQDGEAYAEWNFSPSGQSARYDFSAYRTRCEAPTADDAPTLAITHDAQSLNVDALVDVPAEFGDRLRLGLSAVVEDTRGTLHYWALRHRPGKPDFHHRDAFAIALDLAIDPGAIQERTA